MTKKQKEEALAFMYENGVELVVAPFGVYHHSSCVLCYYNALGFCPELGDALMCRKLASDDFKTFFRKIEES